MLEQGDFVRHEPCENCGSSDANSLYSNGSKFCYSCRTYTPAEGKYKIKFSWNEEARPPVVDTEGSPVTDKKTPLYGGSTVKLGFYQKPYILKDGVTYGSSLKLVGVQVVSVKGDAGVDTGDLDETEVAELFGKTDGFKAAESPPDNVEDEDF